MLNNIIRALRLPFASASALPFIFGSLIYKNKFNFTGFALGFIAAVTTHLSSNLINDYADSKSGADWREKKFYKFFGGSKLIQEGVFTEGFYFRLAVIFAAISLISVLWLAFILGSIRIIIFYFAIIFLGWSYSCRPFQFSYRRLGEIIIFLLFGPALVMGGYFIQSGIFPDFKSLALSLPFGLMTSAILFVNEVPDFPDDNRAGKRNLVSMVGAKNSFIFYYALIIGAFLSIASCIMLGYLSLFSLASIFFIFPAVRAGKIIMRNFDDKERLVESSKLTIGLHGAISIVLIISALL